MRVYCITRLNEAGWEHEFFDDEKDARAVLDQFIKQGWETQLHKLEIGTIADAMNGAAMHPMNFPDQFKRVERLKP